MLIPERNCRLPTFKWQPSLMVRLSEPENRMPPGSSPITLRTRLWIGRPVILQFRHADYQPLDQRDFIGDKVYVAKMLPIPHETPAAKRADVVVANIQVRYSIKTTTTANVGSAVQAFEVPNVGNMPCAKQPPCSPDGKWKAAMGSKVLDAGENNEFRNARTSCIAGPCPFTKIEGDSLSQNGRLLTVSARNWSDTATFLVEAEVVHPMVSDLVRTSYPVTFGQALNFHDASGCGGNHDSGRGQWRGYHLPTRPKSLSQLGRLQRPCKQRSDKGLPL